ncbi:hypothetical protein ACWCXH_35405 [Kitasatospora sp. NPDC001660]
MSGTGVSTPASSAHVDAPRSRTAGSTDGGLFVLPASRRQKRPKSRALQQPTTPQEFAAWLDARLFSAPIFLIGADNKKLATSRPRTLAEASSRVLAGEGRSYVAHARAGVCCVDIDGEDPEWSVSALERLVRWAESKGLWWVSRRSGGGDARWHLIVLIPPSASYRHAEDEFRALVQSVRVEWGATSRQIDWRRTLRPLSAPHRSSGEVELPEDVAELWRSFPSWARDLPERRMTPVRAEQPAMPWTRSRKDISNPEFWDRLRSPDAVYASDRSLSELLSTARLAIAGYTCESAWSVVADSRNAGFARSRGKGQGWWTRYVWEKAVEYVDSHSPVTARRTPQARWQRVVGPLLLGVRRQFWDGLKPVQRHSAERLLAAVGDRMARQTLANCPMPERDLEADSGLARNTVRAMLRHYESAGVLVRTHTYDYSEGSASSHQYALNLLALDFTAESTEPPCSHTLGHPGRSWYTLATTLALTPGPHTETSLYHLSGYSSRLQPSSSQLRNVSTGLTALVQMKVVRRTASGSWELTRKAGRATKAAVSAAVLRTARIARERAAFSVAREKAQAAWKSRWEAQRARAVERRAVADQKRRDAWWESLTQRERDARRAAWQERFAALSPGEREERVLLLRNRRAMASLGAAA